MLKKLNLLRVPPEVELDGLDIAEYEPDIHVPEFAHAEDLVIEPDGTRVPAESKPMRRGTGRREQSSDEVTEADAGDNRQRSRLRQSKDRRDRGELGVEDSADFVVGDNYHGVRRLHDLRAGFDLRRGGRRRRTAPTWR